MVRLAGSSKKWLFFKIAAHGTGPGSRVLAWSGGGSISMRSVQHWQQSPCCFLSMLRLAAAWLYEPGAGSPPGLCLPQNCVPCVQLSRWSSLSYCHM